MKKTIVGLVCLVAFVIVACTPSKVIKEEEFSSWQEVVETGTGKNVSVFMWGGNDAVNLYFDEFISEHVKELYDIDLTRVPMNAPDFVAKVLNEKKNNVEDGTIDILWINAENFKTLKEIDGLYGPFTQLLDNQTKYYDQDLGDLHYDSGVAIEGTEAIFGSAQLVFTYDEARVQNPPRTYEEILDYAKENPGTITYPNPIQDFVGAAFMRNAYFELTDNDFTQEYTYEEFVGLSQPVINYFKELHPYMWNEGEVFPGSIAQQDDMFKNGTVELLYGFEVYRTAGLIERNEYPESVKTYVLETGTLGNSHYLAIPYNAPQKAAAMLVIDFLQSPEAQIEKMKPSVWGDMSAIDTTTLSEEQLNIMDEIQDNPAIIPTEVLLNNRHSDMKAQYIDWIKQIWDEEIINS